MGAVFRRYKWRMKKWARYAAGRSLHHAPQGVGLAYQPGRLEGYFNDLTGKTRWSGACDVDGIPIVTTDRGNKFSFPITVFQKGLGHWDLWLLSGKSSSKDRDDRESLQRRTGVVLGRVRGQGSLQGHAGEAECHRAAKVHVKCRRARRLPRPHLRVSDISTKARNRSPRAARRLRDRLCRRLSEGGSNPT